MLKLSYLSRYFEFFLGEGAMPELQEVGRFDVLLQVL
jgi:hypothetical protein